MQTNTNNKIDLGTPRVPVLDSDMKPLMPTTPSRARFLMEQGKASAYRNKLGVFCIILHQAKEPNNQPLALGIDPGSKFEGWSVVGTKYTVLNGMSEAPTWVKENVSTRSQMRRARRFRNCPRRQQRSNNRAKQCLPPSTKSRWQAKLNIVRHIQRILPIEVVVVEDIKAESRKDSKKWNTNFSPLGQGKNWLYSEINNLGLRLVTWEGQETKAMRDQHQLDKCKQKDKAVFQSHAVDAWCLAASQTGAEKPSWRGLFYWTPIRLHRRRLHMLQLSKGGLRRENGGTRSMGWTRGTLVKHIKYDLTYIGGTLKGKISLHRLKDGKRVTQKAKVEDLDILTTTHRRARLIHSLSREALAVHD